eukprot:6182795-Pleurochrysis_carterae.AAC.1
MRAWPHARVQLEVRKNKNYNRWLTHLRYRSARFVRGFVLSRAAPRRRCRRRQCCASRPTAATPVTVIHSDTSRFDYLGTL